jgi:hypothetical protein
MRKTFIAIATVTVLLPASWAIADDFPFVGKWNCGVSDFTFTNRTYNISGGGETLPILKFERFGSDYRLGFAKGYALALLNIKPRTMTWRSLASGDTFSCKRNLK